MTHTDGFVCVDPRISEESGEMPFDGKRMIYGGFDTLLDM